MHNRWFKKIIPLFFLLLLGGGVFYFASTAQGVNRTWDGGGVDGTCGGAGTANNWSCPANWSADTAPTASDVAIFDGTSTKDATINANISVAGISINAGYTGTITQSSTYTVTVGSSHYSQAAGTFTGGSGTIDINGTFTLSGGTFTSTSGTLEVGRSAGSETVFTISGSTFNHNNGTIKFAPSGSSGGRTFTINVDTTLTLSAVQIDPSAGDYLSVASGDTIIATGSVTHMTGAVEGLWEAQENVIISSTAEAGGGIITMTGTGSKTYTYSAGGVGPHLRVNNAALSVSPNAGTTALALSKFSLLAGTFTAPTGVLQVGRNTDAETTFSVTSGTTFNHNNGTVKFIPDGYSGFQTFTIDVDTTLTLFDVEVSLGQGDGFITAGGDTIIVANNFTHTNGELKGTWQVQGNYTVGTGADGGTAGITFTGSNNQVYTDSGGNETDGDVLVNKSAGTVTLASNADWNAGSQDVTITGGTLASATYNITTTNFTVNGGTFTGGSGTVTTAGPMTVSSGTFTGGAGNITISNGDFTLSGGTFTSTSGTLSLGKSTGASFTHTAGGTFNHNNGTVLGMNTSYIGASFDVATTETFYNFTVTAADLYGSYIAAGDTIVVLGTFTHTDGKLEGGTVEVRGNVVVGSGADTGSTTVLSFLVAGDQTITGNGGNTGVLSINKASGTLSAGSTNLGIHSLILSGGTFKSTSGILRVAGKSNEGGVFTHTAGGTFDHSNGTVNMASNGNVSIIIDVATSETFNNFIVSMQHTWYTTISSGDTLVVLGTLTITDGELRTGTIEARGDVVIGVGADGGTAGITFTGGNTQIYTDQGGNEPDGDVTINKSANSVTLASNADWNAAGQDLTITSGTLLQTGAYAVATGAVTVGASGKWVNSGTGAVTLGGALANSGLIDFRSNNTCGGADSILLRSSGNGIQRAWSGAGTFVMRDIDVRDMGGSATLTAYSSTNTSGNGGNWTFNATCPFPIRPDAGLSTGKINMQSGKLQLQ